MVISALLPSALGGQCGVPSAVPFGALGDQCGVTSAVVSSAPET